MWRAQRYQPFARFGGVMAAASSPDPIFYGVPAEIISELCGVTVRQARAYKRGTAHAHPSVIQLVTLYTEGRILGEAFAGWAVDGADLVDPEGRRTSHAMLRAYSFVWQLARELAQEKPDAMEELDRIAGIATARMQRSGRSGRDATAAGRPPNPRDGLTWRDLDASDPSHPPRKRA